MKNKISIFNLVLFITSTSILAWNYSIYTQIDPLAEEARHTFQKISDYHDYKASLKESGMNQQELNDFLIKYGNGSLQKRLEEVNQAIEEERLMSNLIILSFLTNTNDEQKLADLIIKYTKFIEAYYEELSDKQTITDKQKIFLEKYTKYKMATPSQPLSNNKNDP